MVEALSDWEKFLHVDSALPLIVKIGLAYAQFESIHPFLDGNGRVGRLLIKLLLCEGTEARNPLLQSPVLYLSTYFKEHRSKYYELLQNVQDKGNGKPGSSSLLMA